MKPRTVTALALLPALCAVLAGCGSTDSPPAPAASTGPAGSASGTAGAAATIADRLDTPWGVARLPDGALLVGSRNTGRILRIDPQTGARTDVGTVPGVAAAGEGGLLGLALGPDDRLYAYLTATDDNRIVRFGYDPSRPAGARLTDPAVVLTGIPKGSNHDGGRIAFGPDGLLYVGTGESGRPELAQDRTSLGGKILRITPAGDPAPGNPFPGSPVYSLGHRNVQGLAWDPQGRLWASEFGQNTWDELNLITPGANYGWPVVEGKAGRAGYADPVTQWHPADASPSGIAYADGAIWMAGLRGQRLWRIPLNGDGTVGTPTAVLDHTDGRLRTVLAETDGTLIVTTNNTDGRGAPGPDDDRVLRYDPR
ncbi:glucose/arabinose dehydrogenase [Streptomyces sp. TLI_235]|nr:PQQ-dependent sugar dehydrogenase [Streptomyces sp. TLI_235]PBC70761.1 glucose/arabinose dehydrogenase [Streptomyces sp. TLI_235]